MSDLPQDPHRGKRVLGQVLISIGAAIGILSLIGFLLGGGWTSSDLLSALIGMVVTVGLPIIVGLYLLRQAGPAPATLATPAGELVPLSGLRIFFVVVGGLITLFAGGCTLIFLGSLLLESPGPDNFVTAPVVLVFGGPPFVIGLVILLLALRAGRRRGGA
jgi:hypothetical protein